MNANSYIEPSSDVENHLSCLRKALSDENCILDILPKKKEQLDTDRFTTQNTMIELNFDSEDVKQVLKELTYKDYIENVKDSKHQGSNDFHVFGTCISDNEIYIKEKLRTNSSVFCISFHFAEYPLKTRPYQ